MLLAHSTVLIMMSGQALDIFLLSTKKTAHFDFPPGTVSHLTVNDAEIFSKSLTAFIESLAIKDQSYVLLLNPELVFQREFANAEKKESTEELRADFITLLPFPEHDISLVTRETKTSTTFLATPAPLFTLIKDCLQKSGWKNDAVIAFQILENIKFPLTAAAVQQVLKQAHSNSKLSFQAPLPVKERKVTEVIDDGKTTPVNEASENAPAPEKKKPSSKTLPILLFILLLVVVGGRSFRDRKRKRKSPIYA